MFRVRYVVPSLLLCRNKSMGGASNKKQEFESKDNSNENAINFGRVCVLRCSHLELLIK